MIRRAIGLGLFGCLAFWVTPGQAQDNKPLFQKDLVYAQAGDVKLQLDFARPDGDGPFPAVVCIHGGAWIVGNRSAHQGTIQLLAKHGFAAATISYRLAPKHKFPAQLEDAKAAIRFVRAKAKDFKIDPGKIAVLGDSAGGHLALLAGLMDAKTEFDVGEHLEQSSRVQAIVNIYGPTDFLSWKATALGETMLKTGLKKDSDGVLVDFLGTSDRKDKVMKIASPIIYVTKDDPPVLTFNGTDDPLVPDQQARLLHEALKKAGVVERLEILEGAGHGFVGKDRKRVDQTMVEFLHEQLRGKKR